MPRCAYCDHPVRASEARELEGDVYHRACLNFIGTERDHLVLAAITLRNRLPL